MSWARDVEIKHRLDGSIGVNADYLLRSGKVSRQLDAARRLAKFLGLKAPSERRRAIREASE